MRKILKITALMLVCLSILSVFGGCASKGKTLMELDGTELSVNTFKLFLSRMKGNLSSAYYYGNQANSDSFWDQVRDGEGNTNNSYYTNIVLEDAKTYLAALYLFDELKLKLPDSYEDEIEEKMDEYVALDGGGSKSALNAKLADYGVNYNILKDAYMIEAKISYLRDHLFGVNGSKIATEYVEDYYEENYVRYKQIFFYTYKNLYEKDENGDSIYYTEDGKISYDKEKGVIKTDKDGNRVKDTNGDYIYIIQSTGKVAYDNQKGTRRQIYDDKGNPKTEPYSEEELMQVVDQASVVYDKMVEGNFTVFETLMEYNEDDGAIEYPNGYYISKDSTQPSEKLTEKLFDMEVGDIAWVDSDYGIHLVMKYELEPEGYNLEANSDFFIGKNSGNIVFMTRLIDGLFTDYLAKYVDMVKVNDKILEGVDMKSVSANTTF